MKLNKFVHSAFFTLFLLFNSSVNAQNEKIYWPNEASMSYVSLNGGDVQNPEFMGYITALGFDTENNKLYFYDDYEGGLYRSDLDFTNIEELLFELPPIFIQDIEYDHFNQKLVLAGGGDGSASIWTVNTDGTELTNLYTFESLEDFVAIPNVIINEATNKLFFGIYTFGDIFGGGGDDDIILSFLEIPGVDVSIRSINLNDGLNESNLAETSLPLFEPISGIAVTDDGSKLFYNDGLSLTELDLNTLVETNTVYGETVFINNIAYSDTLQKLVVSGSSEIDGFIGTLETDGTGLTPIVSEFIDPYATGMLLKVFEPLALPDRDEDGTPDISDECPDDANKVIAGICGCGILDDDTDSDGAADCNDLCSEDDAKLVPGVCGCGAADVDTDSDQTLDCNDECPEDPDKIAVGICGCGVADVDLDQNGTADCLDDEDGEDEEEGDEDQESAEDQSNNVIENIENSKEKKEVKKLFGVKRLFNKIKALGQKDLTKLAKQIKKLARKAKKALKNGNTEKYNQLIEKIIAKTKELQALLQQ